MTDVVTVTLPEAAKFTTVEVRPSTTATSRPATVANKLDRANAHCCIDVTAEMVSCTTYGLEWLMFC